jgi:hypothetical protein
MTDTPATTQRHRFSSCRTYRLTTPMLFRSLDAAKAAAQECRRDDGGERHVRRTKTAALPRTEAEDIQIRVRSHRIGGGNWTCLST